MDYLKATIEKIENATSERTLREIEIAVNYPPTGWSDEDKATINARIKDVREFWGRLGKMTPSDDVNQYL